MEICQQGLYFYVKRDDIRISPFFHTEDQALEWWISFEDSLTTP